MPTVNRNAPNKTHDQSMLFNVDQWTKKKAKRG